MDKENAKRQIKELVDDFRANYQQHKKELEANTETKLIEPLFGLLGWSKSDFVKQQKARREEKRGHADYAFKINDKIVFFLEVKKVGILLEKEADKQVISYALSKRVPFAVSTNFEQMKIFCVEQENAINNKFRVFNSPDDYTADFENLYFLSKESFEQGLILKKAESEGRLKKRVSIDKALLEDLMHIRSLIASDIERRYPEKYELNERDEIVQRIIDRLIFIRRCEDVGINPDDLSLKEITLLPGDKAHHKLKEIFKKYDNTYDSGLFAIGLDNDCDKIAIDGEIIKKLICYLYESKDGNYVYNFDWIDADVLGQVYEQYLGKILAQTKSGKAKLKDGQAHRKEQGIYYTPTYIVDYIVKNTVGELLKDRKIKAKDIKILDPACGSGSFLIKAFDCLHENLSSNEDSRQYKIDSQGAYSIKTEILKNNIYGVDLDNKAVEITKLNLLLKAAEKERKLPEELDMHIKHGNSLIDDEKVAGLDAFKWEEKFKEIMANGGFDVVIGNPPWGAKITDSTFFEKKYTNLNLNSFSLFLYTGLSLLSDAGVLGFIIPKNFIRTNDYATARKMLLEGYTVLKIIDAGKFPGVVQEAVILVIKKKVDRDNLITTGVLSSQGIKIVSHVKQKDVLHNPDYIFDIYSTDTVRNIKDKIVKNAVQLGTQIILSRGIETGKTGRISRCDKCGNWIATPRNEQIKRCNKCESLVKISETNTKNMISAQRSKEHQIPIIAGNQVTRYGITKMFWLIPKLPGINYKNEDFFKQEKIVVVRILPKIVATINDDGAYTLKTLYNLNLKKEAIVSLKHILAILNSKLFAFYYEYTYNVGGNLTPSLTQENIDKFPIATTTDKKLEEKVDRMLTLSKQLNEIGDKKTAQSAKIEEEIRKTDEEIDGLVYGIYGLTEKEIRIVEESLR